VHDLQGLDDVAAALPTVQDQHILLYKPSPGVTQEHNLVVNEMVLPGATPSVPGVGVPTTMQNIVNQQ